MELNNATMLALLEEQEAREMAFFEAEVSAFTEAMYGKPTDKVKEMTTDLAERKTQHRDRIAALRQAQAAYAFGFQIDHALLLTSRALAFILSNKLDGNVSIPKEDLDDENAYSPQIIIEEGEYIFQV